MSNIDFIKRNAKILRQNAFCKVTKDFGPSPSLKIRKIKIKLGEKIGRGQNAEVFLADSLVRKYGRKNLCVKIFKNSRQFWGYDGSLGKSSIRESVMAQNLMALKGLAPRVYDVVDVDGKIALVTDRLQKEGVMAEIKDDRFNFQPNEIKQPHNLMDGKLVDFQGVSFRDFRGYRKKVFGRVLGRTQFPASPGSLYQSTPYHSGKRNTERRLKQYNFKNFRGKNVLDIGGNIGMFCRAACDLGAKRVVCLDQPHIIEVAKELSILDGYFNIDFYGVDLKTISWSELVKITGIEKYDIFLFLAQEMWIGRPSWLNKCKTLYYEGHGKVRPFEVIHY